MVLPALPLAFLPGGSEMWIILVLALLFFGASRLPGVARSLGQSVNEFKRGLKDEPPLDAKNEQSPPSTAGKN